MTSPRFHYYVRVIHAMMNDLPTPKHPNFHRLKHKGNDGGFNGGFGSAKPNNTSYQGYTPTVRQRMRIYLYIFEDEMKNAFLFRK